ncbi:MAG: HAD-IC family P-type ATPase, partial [Planctomycetes bacterium]|nr:HAD-IC family P-type ATPase [Planctomycetota bacterium]
MNESTGHASVRVAPWARRADDVIRDLESDASRGLTSAEAHQRRLRYGPNRLRARRTVSMVRVLADQFVSPVVGLLAAASFLAFLFGEWLDGVAILVVLAINSAIGFLLEFRAHRAMEALERLAVAATRVIRDGEHRSLPATELVPGDLVALEAGDRVAADLRLVEVSQLEVDESLLTGESAPVPKQTIPVSLDAPVADRECMVFGGTSVTRGSARAVVVATGRSSELGHIADLVEGAEEESTPLEKRLNQLAQRLVFVCLLIAVLPLAIGIGRGRDGFELLQIGLALAVAAIPEGLPIVATIALARGMWRLARRRALVRRLTAVETLGSVTTIFTDKTGTLTENRMSVESIVTETGVHARGIAADETVRRALEVAVRCNKAALGARVGGGSAVGDPLEIALIEAAAAERPAAHDRVREIPFDPATRRMATIDRIDSRLVVSIKGA